MERIEKTMRCGVGKKEGESKKRGWRGKRGTERSKWRQPVERKEGTIRERNKGMK